MYDTSELEAICERIIVAVFPEDIFGVDSDKASQFERIKKIYHQLARKVHSDTLGPHVAQSVTKKADKAFTALTELYEKARQKIRNGTYGIRVPEDNHNEMAEPILIKTRQHEYSINTIIAQGDLSTVCGGMCLDDSQIGSVVIKIIEDPQDNDFMKNEIRILRYFKECLEAHPAGQSKHLPTFLEEFRTTDGQLALVLRYLEDCYDGYSDRERYPHGIPPSRVAWRFSRLLSVIGYAHSQGVLHGHIEPAHLMFCPKDHNAFLIDWSYAIMKPAETGEGFRAYNEEYSAPEVPQRKSPLPSSDLYSLGKCMIFLLGGDIKTHEMPREVDIGFQRFIHFFLRESPLQRPQDAWEMYEELEALRVKIWGPKKFEVES